MRPPLNIFLSLFSVEIFKLTGLNSVEFIDFNWFSFDFNLLSIDFQLISIYFQLIFNWFQLIFNGFQLISIYFQFTFNWFQLIFNWFQFTFNWLQFDFNWFQLILIWFSIDFHMFSIDFQLISIYFQLKLIKTIKEKSFGKGKGQKEWLIFFTSGSSWTHKRTTTTNILLRIRVAHGLLPWKIVWVLFFNLVLKRHCGIICIYIYILGNWAFLRISKEWN